MNELYLIPEFDRIEGMVMQLGDTVYTNKESCRHLTCYLFFQCLLKDLDKEIKCKAIDYF
ncbi:MAG: hypothetical protein ACI4DN_04415 [Lachnospiraceae bacterium]